LFCNFCNNEWDINYVTDDTAGTVTCTINVEKIDDSACVNRLAALLSRTESPPDDDLMAQIATLVRKTGRPVPNVYV
jgi:hypothetical protein